VTDTGFDQVVKGAEMGVYDACVVLVDDP